MEVFVLDSLWPLVAREWEGFVFLTRAEGVIMNFHIVFFVCE